MPYFNESPDTYDLTKDERNWCKKLENLLKKTPPRFGIATVGNAALSIFDRDECELRGIEQEEDSIGKYNLVLATIESSKHIQGWCG